MHHDWDLVFAQGKEQLRQFNQAVPRMAPEGGARRVCSRTGLIALKEDRDRRSRWFTLAPAAAKSDDISLELPMTSTSCSTAASSRHTLKQLDPQPPRRH